MKLKQRVNYLQKQWISRLKYALNPQLLYGKTAFYDDTRAFKQQSIQAAADLIIETFHPKTVVDIGCGEGLFLKPLHDKGIAVIGCDISEAALQVSSKEIVIFQADATKPIRFNRRFDLCICVEIAEHIPTRASKTLVENVTRASDTVFFTAALPWQGGVGHINEQPHAFWIALFAEEGFVLEEALTHQLRHQLETQGVVFWLHRNLLLFRRK